MCKEASSTSPSLLETTRSGSGEEIVDEDTCMEGAGTNNVEVASASATQCDDETQNESKKPPRIQTQAVQLNYQSAGIHRQKVLAGKSKAVPYPILIHNGRRIAPIPPTRSQLRQSMSFEPTTPTKNVGPSTPGSSDSTISLPGSNDGTILRESPRQDHWKDHRRSPTVQNFSDEEWEAAISLILLHQHATYAELNNIPHEVLRNSYVTRFGTVEDAASQAAARAIATTPAAFNNEDLRWLIWAIQQMGNQPTARNFQLLAFDFNLRFPNKQMTAEQLYYKWAGWHEEMSRANRPIIV